MWLSAWFWMLWWCGVVEGGGIDRCMENFGDGISHRTPMTGHPHAQQQTHPMAASLHSKRQHTTPQHTYRMYMYITCTRKVNCRSARLYGIIPTYLALQYTWCYRQYLQLHRRFLVQVHSRSKSHCNSQSQRCPASTSKCNIVAPFDFQRCVSPEYHPSPYLPLATLHYRTHRPMTNPSTTPTHGGIKRMALAPSIPSQASNSLAHTPGKSVECWVMRTGTGSFTWRTLDGWLGRLLGTSVCAKLCPPLCPQPASFRQQSRKRLGTCYLPHHQTSYSSSFSYPTVSHSLYPQQWQGDQTSSKIYSIEADPDPDPDCGLDPDAARDTTSFRGPRNALSHKIQGSCLSWQSNQARCLTCYLPSTAFKF